jgi:hypothetical protein
VIKISFAKFEVLIAMLINVKVFWDFEPWHHIPEDLATEKIRCRPTEFLTNVGKHIYEKQTQTYDLSVILVTTQNKNKNTEQNFKRRNFLVLMMSIYNPKSN